MNTGKSTIFPTKKEMSHKHYGRSTPGAKWAQS